LKEFRKGLGKAVLFRHNYVDETKFCAEKRSGL
jgi:hypothetical protein